MSVSEVKKWGETDASKVWRALPYKEVASSTQGGGRGRERERERERDADADIMEEHSGLSLSLSLPLPLLPRVSKYVCVCVHTLENSEEVW